MPYRLVLSEPKDKAATTRDVGENIFLDNLPDKYNVYLFYYPGSILNNDLEGKLRKLGEIAGKNLFVNIGRLNDPDYSKIANAFQIKSLPVIVMTAADNLASALADFLTAYIRIDNEELLGKPDLVVQCVQRLFNLFIQGKISEAMAQKRREERNILISSVKGVIKKALKGIWEYLKETDISISVGEYKLELKHREG